MASRTESFAFPNVACIGGVSAWIQATGVAAAFTIKMSSHLLLISRRVGGRGQRCRLSSQIRLRESYFDVQAALHCRLG
jgi:hypothetical protein